MAVKLTLQVRYLGYFEVWEVAPGNIVEDVHVYEFKGRLYETETNQGLNGTQLITLYYRRAPLGEPLPAEWTENGNFYNKPDGTWSLTLPFNRPALEGWLNIWRAYNPTYNIYSNEVSFTVGKFLGFTDWWAARPLWQKALIIITSGIGAVGSYYALKKAKT